MFAVLRNVDLAECLTGQLEVVVDFLLAELADAYLVIKTGNLSDLHLAVEGLSVNPACQFSALLGVSSVEGIDEHVGLLVRCNVATNSLTKHLGVAIDIKQVVLQLEGQAHLFADAVQPVDILLVYNIDVKNPSDSPNTDGLDPDSSSYINVIGCHFSVGDDCIAIKSGKISMVEKYYKPSSYITIRNCLMEDGHGAIVLGSELSSGVSHLSVSKCYFKNTDRGLRIKTRRGRGDKAIVDNVEFDHIFMPEQRLPNK